MRTTTLGLWIALLLCTATLRPDPPATPPPSPTEMMTTLVAATTIQPGWTVKTEHLKEVQRPLSWKRDGQLHTPESIVGRVARERILAAEIPRVERLWGLEEGWHHHGGWQIAGHRAYRLEIHAGDATDALVAPGNWVDVIAVCDGVSSTVAESLELIHVHKPRPPLAPSKQTPPERHEALLAVPTATHKELVASSRSCDHYLALRSDVDITGIVSNEPTGAPERE